MLKASTVLWCHAQLQEGRTVSVLQKIFVWGGAAEEILSRGMPRWLCPQPLLGWAPGQSGSESEASVSRKV